MAPYSRLDDPLRTAILDVRQAGYADNAEWCARLADDADRLLAQNPTRATRDPARDAVFEIVALAVSRIRRRAAAGDARGCAEEADHVHNLVEALVEPHPTTLAYYWYFERRLDDREHVAAFARAWAALEPFVPPESVLRRTDG